MTTRIEIGQVGGRESNWRVHIVWRGQTVVDALCATYEDATRVLKAIVAAIQV